MTSLWLVIIVFMSVIESPADHQSMVPTNIFNVTEVPEIVSTFDTPT